MKQNEPPRDTEAKPYRILSCVMSDAYAASGFLSCSDREWYRSAPACSLLRFFLVLCIFTAQILLGGEVWGQDDNPTKTSETDQENLRTRTRQEECSIGVQFEIRVVPPKDSTAGTFETPFAGARQGLDIPSNGHIELGVKNLLVEPLPGTVSFAFFRGPAG